MKTIFHILLSIMASLILCAGWLYASGNMPFLFPKNENVINAINGSYPDLASTTFQQTHHVFNKLRDKGIAVPQSYNEQMKRIMKIRIKVMQTCNQIIFDS